MYEKIGIHIYNKDTEVHWKCSSNVKFGTHYYGSAYGSKLGWQSMEGPGFGSNYDANHNWIEVVYKNVGSYNDQLIDIKIKFYWDASSPADNGFNWGGSCGFFLGDRYTTYVNLSTNTDGCSGVGRANFINGYTWTDLTRLRSEYSFQYSDGSGNIGITNLYMKAGSLNSGEGIAVYGSTKNSLVSYEKQADAYPKVYNITGDTMYPADDDDGSVQFLYKNNSWVDYDLDWLINLTSNTFYDSVLPAPEGVENDFWKSCAGMYVHDDSGVFKFAYFNQQAWFSPNMTPLGATADKPTKMIIDGPNVTDSVIRHTGDEVVFEVEQPVEIFGYTGTGFMKYQNFSFTDTLPAGITYKSAKVLKRTDSDTDVTSYGTLSYNTETQTVVFNFNSSYLTGTLKPNMVYTGESYVLQITCILDDNISRLINDATSFTLKNKAYTIINDTQMYTNEVSVTQQYYKVKYDANNYSNPNHYTGEFTQNVTTGMMDNSVYEYNIKGSLKKNDYAREGYTFIGWNTKADGSGTTYIDEYDNVLNWSTADNESITLYAQWEKQLGTETITIISEETGNPISDVTLKLYKDVNGIETYVTTATTGSGGLITVEDLHWFNYKWVIEAVPAGYVKSANTDFTINYNQLSAENDVILYMKHVSITIDSRVDCIINEENAPAFLYHIDGTDAAGVNHSYNVLVQTDKSMKYGTSSVMDIFAGIYTITQIPVSRYKAETAENISNSQINDINATVDVLNHDLAEVLFPYMLTNHGWYYGVDSKINSLTSTISNHS